ncbi:phycobilisome protein [filamentous cyanobacterium LEGE 11480]|uniref:Phycobilisome protein n=1 Tax=Romeriopsis navalis LEGE 11480 TaxID=2777977 RepID=A0A928Z2F1_9CYAN|nr:phycobilisome protein [Romeriopsis navalis]MBE9028982.1 phycobilisome protein [Romeriopsis navalis LEGE 11480]
MLSQMQRLTTAAEGRYATDEELRFLPEYLRSYELRMQTYQQLQKSEITILKQVFSTVMQQAPELFSKAQPEQLKHCQQDTLQTLRYCAAAMLVNDADTLRERYLLWLQTIVRAFDKQHSNDLLYTAMQQAVKQHLSAAQADLIVPLIQDIHLMLSATA